LVPSRRSAPSRPGEFPPEPLTDPTIITGEALTPGDVHGIAERVELKTEGVRIRVEDRMTEDADWY